MSKRQESLADEELQTLLAMIDEAHRAGRLNTHRSDRWAGASTQRAIADVVKIGKNGGRLRYPRDAYYMLRLGLPLYRAGDDTTSDTPDLHSVRND